MLPIIAGNWKMNTTLPEAVALASELKSNLAAVDGVEIVICPPFISLERVREVVKGSQIKLGAQNVYCEEKGAYTGEISPTMLSGLCEFVIIGHSERRRYFGESSTLINKKIRAALKFCLRPILCIGEEATENESGITSEVLQGQLEGALYGISDISNIVIAYEPIWAIGSGKTPQGKEVAGIFASIRAFIEGLYSKEEASKLPLLYGGSVTPENCLEFFSQEGVNGALVGGASLRAEQFTSIVRQAASSL